MTIEDFRQIVNARLGAVVKTLTSKRQEYAPDQDVLANFKRSAQLRSKTPGDALLGNLVKHWTSIEDIVKIHGIAASFYRRTPDSVNTLHALIEEKITDALCYLILLEAVLKEGKLPELEDRPDFA